MMRVMLYEAAQSMLHSKKWSWLKAWAMQIARRSGLKKAIVALARRLGDHAPHLGRRHRVLLDPGTSRGSSMKTVQDQIQ